MASVILTLNAGSSSIKAAMFASDTLQDVARVQADGIGAGGRLTVDVTSTGERRRETCTLVDHDAALSRLLSALTEALGGGVSVAAVGHRVVHGGADFHAPVLLTPDIEARLAALAPLAPLHQPHNLACVSAARRVFGDALQVACFDTAFHQTRPWVSQAFALPQRYEAAGVRRYGFHGTSYESVSQTLATVAPSVASGRVVIAHLGNGASLCAVLDGRSIETTMGFSPLEGLTMGTRPGRLDAGVVLYMLQHEGMSADAIARLLNTQSGLLGLSGEASDMRSLEASDTEDAARAIDHFVYRVRQELGAMVMALGGLDGLVFTGGIGENAATIRSRVCDGLDWLGIAIDAEKNTGQSEDISAAGSRVRTFVIQTDEERMIAAHAKALMA